MFCNCLARLPRGLLQPVPVWCHLVAVVSRYNEGILFHVAHHPPEAPQLAPVTPTCMHETPPPLPSNLTVSSTRITAFCLLHLALSFSVHQTPKRISKLKDGQVQTDEDEVVAQEGVVR